MNITTAQKKINVLVVDDEPLARRLIIANLDKFDHINIISESSSGRDAIEKINTFKPDLMFLDIQMPVIGGFDVIKSVDPNILPTIIFVTAYEDYAIDAFDTHAVDYILKPISEKRFEEALIRAVSIIHEKPKNDINKDHLIHSYKEIAQRVKDKTSSHTQNILTKKNYDKIPIKDGNNVLIVEQSDIDWIDAAGDYMCINIGGEIHIMRSTMKDLLPKLNNTYFKRIHRSTIVNLDKIIKIEKHKKGEYFLYLECDKILKVSRHYRREIKKYIEEHL